MEIYSLLRWTIPIHALIPAVIGLVAMYGGDSSGDVMSWLWMFIHLAFPVFLVLTYPLWHGRGEEVVVVITINHLVTFLVGMGLLMAWPG